MRQYLEFMESAVPQPAAYADRIPPLAALCTTYGLDPAAAFDIFRPVLRHLTLRKPEVAPEAAPALAVGSFRRTWAQLLGDVRAMRPPAVWGDITPGLYLTFWGLSLYDLQARLAGPRRASRGAQR